MSEASIEMRVGDRLPQLVAQAIDEYGAPIDVTGYRAYLELVATDADTVFGQPSPYTPECAITNPSTGVVRYDWTQDEADAATAGTIMVRVRFVQIADPDITFTVPTRREASIAMRPAVAGGRVYLLVDDGSELLLDDDGAPMVAV